MTANRIAKINEDKPEPIPGVCCHCGLEYKMVVNTIFNEAQIFFYQTPNQEICHPCVKVLIKRGIRCGFEIKRLEVA